MNFDLNNLLEIVEALPVDTINKKVLSRICERYKKGLETYGVPLEKAEYSLDEWIVHIQEELLDAVLYLEKLKTVIKIPEL